MSLTVFEPDVTRACGVAALAGPIVVLSNDDEQRTLALIVLLNGLLCHLLGFVLWDVAWNVALILWINARTAWQPYTLLLSLFAGLVFRVTDGHPWLAWLHVLGVQLPLMACLVMYAAFDGAGDPSSSP